MLDIKHIAFLLAWLRYIWSAFLLDMSFVGKPLNVFAESIHIRVLKYVDGHNDLIIPEYK